MGRFLTWNTSFPSLQARTASFHLFNSSFSQGPYSELERAAWHMLASVLYADCVHTHLLGNKAHTGGILAQVYYFSFSCLSWGAGDFSCYFSSVNF